LGGRDKCRHADQMKITIILTSYYDEKHHASLFMPDNEKRKSYHLRQKLGFAVNSPRQSAFASLKK